MNLLEETIDLLNRDSRSKKQIAKDAEVGEEWLSKLARGLIADPGVTKIERLNKYLKAEQAA